MACVAKRKGRYVPDFRDHFGARQWITMPKGTTRAKAEEELRIKLSQVAKGFFFMIPKHHCFQRLPETGWNIRSQTNGQRPRRLMKAT